MRGKGERVLTWGSEPAVYSTLQTKLCQIGPITSVFQLCFLGCFGGFFCKRYYSFREILGRLTWVLLQQPQEHRSPVLRVHAGSFRVSVIHRPLIWTTDSLTCVRDHSYACVYIRGLGTPTTSQHKIFDSEKLTQIFLVLLGADRAGIRTSVWVALIRPSQLTGR